MHCCIILLSCNNEREKIVRYSLTKKRKTKANNVFKKQKNIKTLKIQQFLPSITNPSSKNSNKQLN
jgi:hypothetical protein